MMVKGADYRVLFAYDNYLLYGTSVRLVEANKI